MSSRKTAAIIVAAGSGSRMGGSPKQYWLLADKPVVAHSHATLSAHPAIDQVLVVIGADQEAEFAMALGDVPHITGGASRRESVRRGLEWIAAHGGADRVLIHDAARPTLPARVIDDLLLMLDSVPGAIPVLPVADTLAAAAPRGDLSRSVAMVGDSVDRDAVMRVQTPQGFAFAAILDAHRTWPKGEDATDDAQMLRRAGGAVAAVLGDVALDKLTHPDDFRLAEARLGHSMRTRTATGFDVHRLEAGEELWLGGVLIPHDKGLSGHSDADVALHAITDALLGTIAAGDIGTHFPPSDPQWRGANSAQFLQHAASLIANRGGIVDFIDLTLMCEAPKIGPHRVAMQARIADLLRLSPDQVSIKATTTERLGFTGRGEGIAAQAAATVRVPETR